MGGGEGGGVQGGVVMEGEEIVVDVAAGEGWRGEVYCGGFAMFGFSACLETFDGLEADCFHVATAFQGVGFAVVFGVIANVGVSAEELDGSVPLLFTDCFEDAGVLRGAEGDVADDEEEVDVSVVYCVDEPLLLDCVFHFLDYGIV